MIYRLAVCCAATLACTFAPALADSPPNSRDVQIVYATESGFPAFDRDSHGGNPFATALIGILKTPGDAAAQRLSDATMMASDAQQMADISGLKAGLNLVPSNREKARALVLVFADYGDDNGLASLPGAAFDAARLSRAFKEAGYVVESVIAADASEYEAALQSFSKGAEDFSLSVIYTTGHGIEVQRPSVQNRSARDIFLVPPDEESVAVNRQKLIPLASLNQYFSISGRNYLFYAGCRDNPMQL